MEQSQGRIAKLDEIIQRLYEDNIPGKISDERFAKMAASYEAEQHTLESRVTELKAAMTAGRDNALSVYQFLTLGRKIFVYKAERIDGRRVQRIKIIWNCIGEFTPPATTAQEKSA